MQYGPKMNRGVRARGDAAIHHRLKHGQKSVQNLVGFLGDLKAPKFHSEIKGPLRHFLILLQIHLVSLYFIFLSLRLHLTHLWTDKEFPYCVLKKLVKSISFPFAEFLMAIMVSKVLPSYSLLCTFFSSLRPE